MPTREHPALHRCSCGAIIAIWDDLAACVTHYRHGDGEALFTRSHLDIYRNGGHPAAEWINRVHAYEGIDAPAAPWNPTVHPMHHPRWRE